MEGTSRRAGPAHLATLLLIGIGVFLASAAVTLLLVDRSSAPREGSAEAGFARDMATHHAQAVEMAFLVRDVSEDTAIRTLAYDIILTQAAQRGVFMGWLQQWDLPQAAPGPRMAWMTGHAHASDSAGDALRMMGMATDEELEALRQATGRDAEILFLRLMIRHHEGGVAMAKAVIAASSREDVVGVARHIEQSQAGEIALMTKMLAERTADLARSATG